MIATTILLEQPLIQNHHLRFTTMTFINPKPLKVCFSYAAYAKNLIHYLQLSNIPIQSGLSDNEFTIVEEDYNFTFPADLRSILQEGLPVGPGFPNWRSSSEQQLEILTSLPILGICKEVSRSNFWVDSWGERPEKTDHAVKLAEGLLSKCPILVPIYRHFYIPSKPCMAGNPIFYVKGSDIRVWSFDIAGFFEKVQFRLNGGGDFLPLRKEKDNVFSAPAWAANEAREIEFWTEVATAREGWWSGELGGCLDEVCCTLRDGGWKEEDVKEMMMMDGCDEIQGEKTYSDDPIERRVRILSDKLLRAGWSMEDVVESLGFSEDVCCDNGDSCFYFHSYKSSKNGNGNVNINLQV